MEENQSKDIQNKDIQDKDTQGAAAGGSSDTENVSQNTAGTAAGAPEQARPGVQPCAMPVPWYKTPVFWVSVLLFLALAVLFGLLLHQKYLAEQAAARSQYEELMALKARNDAAEQYLAQLEQLLALDPCAVASAMQGIVPPEGYTLPPVLAPGSGSAPAQAAPQAPAAPVTPAVPADPSDPSAPVAPAQAPQDAQDNSQNQAVPEAAPAADSNAAPAPSKDAAVPGSVAEKLEQATVFILGTNSMGSGFFITPSHIMTNAHVVKGCTSVFFTNKKLGVIQKARIAMFSESNGEDFAVLHTPSPCDITPLEILDGLVSRTQKVSAWGYPGAVTFDDPKLRALLKGDQTAAPEVVYSEGTVNVILDKVPPLIVHSATVSQGNSGGPLVDEQGRVVGINTYIKLDDQSYRQSSLSIPSTIICRYLTENGIPYTQAQKPEAK